MKKILNIVLFSIILSVGCKKNENLQSTQYSVPDRQNVAFVKFINASPGSPSLAFYLDGVKLTGGSSTTGVEAGLSYGSIFPGEYVTSKPVSGGNLVAKVVSSDVANPNLSVFDGPVTFKAGINYSVFGVDIYNAENKKISTLIVEDELPARDTSKAFVRFINLSPNAGPVNFVQSSNVIFSNVAYKTVTGFTAIPDPVTPLVYSVVNPTTGAALISSTASTFTKGRIYTIFIRGVYTPPGTTNTTPLTYGSFLMN